MLNNAEFIISRKVSFSLILTNNNTIADMTEIILLIYKPNNIYIYIWNISHLNMSTLINELWIDDGYRVIKIVGTLFEDK